MDKIRKELASQQEINEILSEANKWVDENSGLVYSVGTALIIAEFMMNRQGKTIYPHRAKFSGE